MAQYRELEAFIWSLGPAAIGLIFVWVAEWRLKRRPETDDKRIAIVSVGAYVTCWAAAVACLSLFVMLWVRLYFSSTSYLQGVIENVPLDFQAATISNNSDDQIYYSDRTLRASKFQTIAWVVRQKAAPAARRVIHLGFQNNTSVLFAEITLADLNNLGNLDEIRFRFERFEQQDKDIKYRLKYSDEKSFELTPLDISKFDKAEANPNVPSWWQNIISAYAQNMPRSTWTKDQLIAGLEARSLSARKSAIDELASRFYDTPEYSSLANQVLAAQGDEASPIRRWSVYEAMRIAYQAKIRTSKRDGILATADQFALALSDSAMPAITHDALSGTATANDAAKWLFRFSPNNNLLKALSKETDEVSGASAKACYAAFTINVIYNWFLDVPLSAKKSEYQWYAASSDFPIVERLFGETKRLKELAAKDPEYSVAGTLALFGLGLFYAEMSILPDDRIHLAPDTNIAQARVEWASKSKATMKQFLDAAAQTPRWNDLYRFPWHKGLAKEIVESPITQEVLDKAGGDRTNNPRIRDFVCISGPLRG